MGGIQAILWSTLRGETAQARPMSRVPAYIYADGMILRDACCLDEILTDAAAGGDETLL